MATGITSSSHRLNSLFHYSYLAAALCPDRHDDSRECGYNREKNPKQVGADPTGDVCGETCGACKDSK